MKKKLIYQEVDYLTNDCLPWWKDLKDENFYLIYLENNFIKHVTFYI